MLEAVYDPVKLLTADEYFETYPETMLPMELIDGEVITMAAPKNTHQAIAGRLYLILAQVIIPHNLGEVRFAPCDVVMDAHNVPQPDLFFVSKDNPRCYLGADDRWHGAPDLCVEILSSNREHDTKTKFKLYEKHGVREYWLIDSLNSQVQVWVWQAGEYEKMGEYGVGASFTSQVLPLTLEVQQIFG